MKRTLVIAAALAVPLALAGCVVEDDDVDGAVTEGAGSHAAVAADAAADRAEAAADRAADGPDVVIDPPDVVVDADDRDDARRETTVRAGEGGLEVTTSERRN